MTPNPLLLAGTTFALIAGTLVPLADAQRGGQRGGQHAGRAGGGGQQNLQVRRTANGSVNHNANANVNRNANVNVNRNVNVNVNGGYYGGGYYRDYDHDYHPLAVAAVAVTTAVVVGSIVRSLPPKCVNVIVGPTTYYQCGSTWYQPQYAGTTVQYVVVTSPR